MKIFNTRSRDIAEQCQLMFGMLPVDCWFSSVVISFILHLVVLSSAVWRIKLYISQPEIGKSTHSTSSVAAGFGRHGMPPPASNPDLWPFDLETGVRVASKVGNLPFKFGHARPLGSRIICHTRRTDGQTDGRTDKSNAYCPFPTGGSIIKCGRRQLAVLLTGGQLDTERRADVNVPAVGGAPCVNQLSQTQQHQVRRTTSRRERSGQEWHDGHRLQRSVMSTSQATFLIRSRSLFIQMTHNIQGGPEMVQLTACSRQNVQSVSCWTYVMYYVLEVLLIIDVRGHNTPARHTPVITPNPLEKIVLR